MPMTSRAQSALRLLLAVLLLVSTSVGAAPSEDPSSSLDGRLLTSASGAAVSAPDADDDDAGDEVAKQLSWPASEPPAPGAGSEVAATELRDLFVPVAGVSGEPASGPGSVRAPPGRPPAP